MTDPAAVTPQNAVTNTDAMFPRRSGLRRRLLILAAKSAFSLGLTFLLLEVGLRAMGVKPITRVTDYHDPALLHPDPAIAAAQRNGWVHWPHETRRIENVTEHQRGFIEIRRNNLSCREDTDTEIRKATGTTRVLVLGDSHTDGVCYNAESYPNQLEAEWNHRSTAGKFEVINAGFGPSSPYQQYWAFEQLYQRLQPDHLVVAWYAGNDLVELLRTDERVHLKWTGSEFVHENPTRAIDATRSDVTIWTSIKSLLRDRLALYHALVQIRGLRALVRSAERDAYRERLETAMAAHSGPVWQGLNQSYYFTHHPEAVPAALRMMEHILSKYKNYTDQQGIGLTIVVIPTLRQIDPSQDEVGLRETMDTLQLTPAQVEWDERMCDELVGVCESQGVSVLDMRHRFRAKRNDSSATPLYYRFDHHLNVHGNAVLAEELDDFLTKQLPTLVPPRP